MPLALGARYVATSGVDKRTTGFMRQATLEKESHGGDGQEDSGVGLGDDVRRGRLRPYSQLEAGASTESRYLKPNN